MKIIATSYTEATLYKLTMLFIISSLNALFISVQGS